ncbi:MAG: hypothetical protein IKA79_09615 [Lentisphaeria bacterium]|nr:hypothetical protein [Lentisphaeria bacterium]
MTEKEMIRTEMDKENISAENALDEVEKEALKKLKRLERDYISPDSGITSGLALPPARYVYMVGLFIALFLLLYLLATALEGGGGKKSSPVENTLQKIENTLNK